MGGPLWFVNGEADLMDKQELGPENVAAVSPTACAPPDPPAPPPARTAVEIEDWLVAYLAKELETSPDQMDVTVPFDRFGLSSATAVFMIANLEEWLGQEVDPTLPYDYPTIQVLARRLAGQPG
jgi:acyl carrier protein